MPNMTLELEVRPETDVLQRVVAVCHRRRYEIVDLTYRRGRIDMTVRAEPRQRGSLERWLAALVDVSAVQHRTLERQCS